MPTPDPNQPDTSVPNQPLPQAPSMPLPTPAAPNASPTGQPTQTDQPTNASATGQPQAATAQITPANPPMRKALFDRVLESMAGGPTAVNGVEQPMSRKSLTAHILAGAITGIVQGASKSYQVPIGPGGSRAAQNAAALSGGFDATGKALEDIKNKPQAQATQQQNQLTAQQVSQYNTMKRNIDLQQTMLGLGNASRAALEAAEAPGKLLWQKAQDQDETTPDQKIVLDNTPQTATDLLKKYPQLSQQNFLLVDHQDILNPDGTPNLDSRTGLPHQMPLFVPVNPNIKLQMDDDTRSELIKNNPDLAKTLDKVPTLTPVSMGFYLDHAQNHIAVAGATDNLTSAGKQITSVTGVPVDIGDAVAKNPVLRRNAQTVSAYFGHGEGADEVIDKMIKNKAVPQNVISALQTALHLSDVDDDGQTVAQQLADKRRQDAAEDKKNDAQKPADSARIQNAPKLINTSTPYLTPAQRTNYVSKLHAGMSNDELDKVQKEASDENDKAFTHSMEEQRLAQEKAAKGDAAIEKGAKPMIGVDANGSQVLVPASDIKKYGLSQVREVGQAENEKVTNARSLLTVFNNNDPDDLGIMQLAAKLDKEGKLGPAASRFQDWLNKSGSVVTNLAGFDAGDPDVQRLFTKLGLSTTGLMQVHVGARGSAQMLEHFEDLAKAKSMSPQAFQAAIATENNYVKMKAMLPKTGKTQQNQQQPTTAAAPKVVPSGAIPGRDASGNIIGYKTADGKVVKF